MPTTSVTIDWDTLAILGVQAAQSSRDGLALTSGWMEACEKILGKGLPKWKSGSRRSVDMQMFVHTGITEFLDGYEEFDNTALAPSRVPIYTPAVSGMLMKIGIQELMQYGNSGDVQGAIQSKIEQLTSNCMGFLQRNWTQRCVASIGSGFSRWTTLNGIDSTAGVFEYLAVGSQTNSIGGLSKSTYSSVIGWQNVVVSLNNAYGTNQSGLYRAVVRTRRHKNGGKKGWIMSDAGIENQKRAVQANERYFVEKGGLDSGVPVEKYHGYTLYHEPQMPVSTATGGSGTNTRPITAVLIDFEDIHPEWMKAVKAGEMQIPDGYFGVGQWGPVDRHQMVAACPMLVAGQNIIEDMGSSALCHSGETY